MPQQNISQNIFIGVKFSETKIFLSNKSLALILLINKLLFAPKNYFILKQKLYI